MENKKDLNTEEQKKPDPEKKPVPETGGRGGLDPSRFGDWEIAVKCVDF
jgi:hypothetical protein